MNNKNKHILALLVDSEYISSRYQQPISLFVKILLIEIDSRSHIYKKKLELFKQCYVFKNVLEKETFLDPNLFYIVEKPEEIFNDLYPYLKNKKELLEYEQKIKLKIECWYYYAPLDWQLTFWEFLRHEIGLLF